GLGADRRDAEGGLPADLATQARVHGARARDLAGARPAAAQARGAVVRLQSRRLARGARAGRPARRQGRVLPDGRETGAAPPQGCGNEQRGAASSRREGGIGRMIRWIIFFLVTTTAQAQPAGLPTREGLPTLAPILEKVMPAVVNIAVLQRSPEEENPLLRDPFFRRFFGGPQQAEPQVAAGSGVIVDAKNGYVLTNAHVVKDAREIMVTLRDNRRLPAKLVGADPGTDVAVVKVEPARLVELKFGDSDALQVGDFVVAIGNPFGIGQTATSGIVSALGRSGLSVEGYEHFIQTDASINPGNSGGALVNLKGALLGINTAIIGPANVGIGFAVPSVLARAVMDQLIRFGEVKRGRLGIAMQPVVGGGDGALIAEVEPNSPAAAAGLRKGDVVIALNGHPVRAPAELRARLGVVPAGESVDLKLQRGRETQT